MIAAKVCSFGHCGAKLVDGDFIIHKTVGSQTLV